MDSAWARLSHCTWNQEWLCHAPHPHQPEASDVISSWGRWEGGERKETPFHLAMKVFHHARSDRKPVLRRIIGCEGCTACNRSSIRRRKDLPDLTTLQAWLRRPMKDSSSLRAHTLSSPHCCNRERKRSSLSFGRRSSPACVSISMPKITRHVVGPSRLWAAIGMCNVANTPSRIASK